MQKYALSILVSICILAGIIPSSQSMAQQPVYKDVPYWQDYSIKYYTDGPSQQLLDIASDRNGVIQILSGNILLHPRDGQFLYPGTLVPDNTYRFNTDKKITSLISYKNQLVYLTNSVVFSNAWAGKVFIKHGLQDAKIFEGGNDFTFLVSDGKALQLVKDSKILWSAAFPDDEAIGIRYQAKNDQFWILGKKSLYTLSAGNVLSKVFQGTGFTSFGITGSSNKVIIGTTDGYITYDIIAKKQAGEIHRKLPVTHITAVEEINGKLWFGSNNGAFSLRTDGKFNYYNGERWLPGNVVKTIKAGPGNSVLMLTTAGVGHLNFKQITLAEKAAYFEDQVRSRHIRLGFNSTLRNMKKGDIATGFLEDSDNDGLWTTMYLGGEIFRYAVTKDSSALQNCRESLDALERLYDINPVPGFPARSFERSGHTSELSDHERWQHAPDKEWDWKSTTSSDEVIGHIFAFGAMAELIKEPSMKNRAITLIDTLMSHILKNDMYLVDFDGQPTMWGKWNPKYVNSFPTNVGDRKLNSSNIVAMLQTAYHFTKKEKYKKKAFELMTKHGYYENMMRPMNEIGKAPADADEHAKHMSDGWNHSDDEMYFVGYWGLYRYAFNDTLKAKYKQQIIDHWKAERPEKEGAWNIFTALTGTKEFDLNEAAWYLKEHPLDLIDWQIENSHRKDIEMLEPNFRRQTTKEVLPPDERPIQRHNGNMFNLDRKGGNGNSEHSAGDIWLLPYWMGRYLGVISAPVAAKH